MTRSRRGSTGVGRRSPLPSGGYADRRAVRGGAEGLTVSFCGDDGRRGEFDFSTLALPGWRAALAEAFGVRVGAAGGLRTLASARNCWAVLMRLTRFLATLDEPPVTPARLTVADMEAFYRHRSRSMRPEYARKEVADVGVFMSSTKLAGVVAPDVMDHLRRRNLTRSIPGVGGYSDGEFTRLVAAARTDVAAIRDRLQAGEDLLARYQADPTALSGDDASMGAELAAIAATGLVSPQEGLFERGVSRRLDVAGRLFLTSRDLAPLMVLLAAVTGRNGETIKELPVEHNVLEGRAIELEVVKRRQGQSRWFDTVAWEIGAPERALHTPGGLYLLLLTLSRRSRGFCGGGHAICMWRNGYRSRLPLGPAEHFAPFAEKLHGSVAMVPWVASRQVNGQAHPVLADPTPGTDVGVPLRVSFNRIKTSVEVRRTRQMGGHLPSAARTNTMQVLFRSYLSGDATTIDWAAEVVGEAVVEAERSALDAHQRALAAAGGTLWVLPGPAEPRQLRLVGLDAATATRVAAGELDTAWTACVDHDHHPVTGDACGRSFLECFHCGNCLITGNHLSGLLGLLDAMAGRRKEMSEDQWWARYGPAWAAIRGDVLAKFSPAELAAAAAVKPVDTMLDLVEEPWEHP